jgi:tetratricopeptide (TPR) repeat protein
LKPSRFLALPLYLAVLALPLWASTLPAAASSQAWLASAQTLERHHDWHALLDLGQRWTQQEADNPLAWFVLGRALGEMKRYPEAIHAYRHNLRLDPRDAYAYNNLGNAYRAIAHYRQAFEAYHGAVRSNPDYILAWHNLGLVFYELKGASGVARALGQLNASDPLLAEAWRKLAIEYAVTRDARVAREAIRILRQLSDAERERMFAILMAQI